MGFEFRVNGRIARPVEQVFDAVVNPDQLSRYFVTLGGISGPLVAGATVTWWGEVPVKVEAVEPNERIVFCWGAMVAKDESPYQTRVEMRFQPLDDGATMVTIAESGWRENDQGQKSSYQNCEGWSQMLACMKACLEYGINLREGYYASELSGKPALEPQL